MNWKFWQRRDDTIGPDPTEAHPLDKSFDAPSGRRSLLADHKMWLLSEVSPWSLVI